MQPQNQSPLPTSQSGCPMFAPAYVGGKSRAKPIQFLFFLLITTLPVQAQQKTNYQVHEYMIPMRDGVHLQTAIITKIDQTKPLPILLTRTPYGVLTQQDFDTNAAKEGAAWLPASWK